MNKSIIITFLVIGILGIGSIFLFSGEERSLITIFDNPRTIIENIFRYIAGDPQEVEIHGLVIGVNDAQTLRAGAEIFMLENATLVEFGKNPDDTSTRAFVQNSSGGILANSTFSGSVAVFNIDLINNTEYWVTVDDDGNSYDVNQTAVGSYPILGNVLNWTNGKVNNGDDNGRIRGVVNLTFTYDVVTLNSPTNASSSGSETEFNATGEILGGGELVNMTLWHNVNGSFSPNITNIISGALNTSIFNINFTEEQIIIWNVEACDDSNRCRFAENNFTLTINPDAPIINVTNPRGLLDYGSVGEAETLNWSVADILLDSCWFDYNGTNQTVTCSANSTTFILETDNLNLTFYANNTLGNESSNFTSWSYKVLGTSKEFNLTTFETANETFTLNVSANESLTGVTLNYGSTSKATEFSNNFSTTSIDIPVGGQNRTFNWTFTYAGDTFNSNNQNQNVSLIEYEFCGDLTVPYINFTFRNETTANESVQATIDSAWSIWLGGGSITKEVSLTNNTEADSHAFCFAPQDRTLNSQVNLTYNNNVSQQRAFISSPILTNSTINQVLFLLPSILGLFGQFQTIDVANNPIATVSSVITRTLGGSIITVGSSLTDSSGLVIFFLNPDITYTGTFSKLGFANNVFTFVPTTDIRFVTMGTNVTTGGSNISVGSNYLITPTNSSLDNNTLTTFGFNVSGTGITFISMNITNSSGHQKGFTSVNDEGNLSLDINTGDNTTFIGTFEVRNSDETLIFHKLWRIGNEFVGDYSIFKQGNLVVGYEFEDFVRLLMAILIMFGVMILMSQNQVADNNESKVAALLAMVWIFSVIGWLNNPTISATTGLAQFGRQYGIAILSTVGGITFFMRRIFN